MSASPAITRYARSLLQLAVERNELDNVHNDMRLIAQACEESRELQLLLKSPVVKGDKKVSVLNKVFAGKVGELAQRFMGILIRKGREAKLYDVAKTFTVLHNVHMRIRSFEVTSAQPLDEEARAKVMAMAKELHGEGEVELTEIVDPSLIGGVIIRHGDEQWDGSVSRKLHDLKKEFSKNPYVAEI